MERIKSQIIFFVVFFAVLSSLSYLFIQIDTDGDGVSDISEINAGTNWDNPCDPDPYCIMCSVVPPIEPEEKPGLLFYGFCIALVSAGVAFLIYRLRKRALEEGEEEEEIEGEIFWE